MHAVVMRRFWRGHAAGEVVHLISGGVVDALVRAGIAERVATAMDIKRRRSRRERHALHVDVGDASGNDGS
jgi:uncharacterized protein (DUF2062 family)